MTTFWRRQPANTSGIFPPVPTPTSGVPYFPQVIGPSTVIGRMSGGTGPTEAIPFAVLGAAIGGSSITQYVITGDITVSINDQVIVINKGAAAATAIALPSATLFAGSYLEIYDWGGNAGDLTFTPFGTEKIMGMSTWKVGSTGGAGFGGSLRLKPIFSGVTGWLAR